LRDYAFCNCYRVLDRVSQYIVAEVIEKGPQDYVEVVFRVTLFNLFTKTETWELLQDELGPLRWSTYDHDKYVAVLDEAKRQGVTIYTAAFQKFPHQFEKTHHHINHLFLLENMMANEFPYKLTKAKNLADVYDYIVSYPGMGEFNTYQLLVNLSYTNILNFHRNDFVVAGCGAISGLTKMFGPSFKNQYKEDKSFAETVLRWLTDHQEVYFERLGLEFSGLGPDRLPLDVSDLEHSTCELDKYCRKAHPNIKGTSKSFRIKQVFNPKSPPSEPVLPKAWSHPKRRVPRVQQRLLKVEKRYEVQCIRNHKVDAQGNKLYHVFWVGYKDSEATWEFESSLLLDAPNAVKDYLASIKNKTR
jgi:alpha-glutamyl/putrescinyl thymine pyrophosphorylase clade 1/Chromo (CHRromatin Organisation MOdifier) domain